MDDPLGMSPAPPEAEPEFGDDDARGLVKAELEPGERLLWSGRHVPKAEPVSGSTVAGLATVVVAGGVSLASFVTLFRHPTGEIAGLVFLGLASFVVTFFVALGTLAGLNNRRKARETKEGTLYALTDRRAIIWVPDRAKGALAVYSIPRGQVARVHRLEYPDGTGDVVLTLRDKASFPWQTPSAFEGIPAVRRVEEQVRRTLIDGPETTVPTS
jgi:hypothetical protein